MWANPVADSWGWCANLVRVKQWATLAALCAALGTLGVHREACAEGATNVAAPGASTVQPTASTTTPTSATARASTATTTAATSVTASATTTGPVAPAPPSPSWGERAAKVWSGAVGLVFDKWPSPLFEANFWNTTLAGVHVVLPLLLAGLLLAARIVERGHGRVPPRLVRQVGAVFTVAGFVVYYGAFNPNVRHPGFYQPQAFYHAYLGQKFADELTQTSLIECTLAAEKVAGKAQTHTQRYVYALPFDATPVLASSVPAATDPTVCSKHFSPERWQAFRSDVEWFLSAVKADEWAQLQRSRPSVSSPGLQLLVSPFVGAPASEARFRALAVLEPALHAAALAVVSGGFGPVAAAATSVTWGCQPFFPFNGGATLFGNSWLACWLLGLGLLRRGAPGSPRRKLASVAGAVSLGLGVSLQPASALALVPLVAAFLARRRAAVDGTRDARVLGTMAVTVVLIGLASTRVAGFGAYVEQLGQRREAPALSELGLPSLLSNHGTERYRFQRVDSAPEPAAEWTALRASAHAEKIGVEWFALALVLGLATVLAWRRRSLDAAAVVGLCLVPLLAQPLPENLGLIALSLFCARRTELALPLLTAVAGAAALANQLVFTDDRAAALTAVLWVSTIALLGAAVWLQPRSARARTAVSEPQPLPAAAP